jgi:hypothetical protein
MHAWLHTYVLRSSVHTHTYMHTYIHTYIHTKRHKLNTYMHIYTFACVHTYTHRYKHTYMHTYTRTYIDKVHVHTRAGSKTARTDGVILKCDPGQDCDPGLRCPTNPFHETFNYAQHRLLKGVPPLRKSAVEAAVPPSELLQRVSKYPATPTVGHPAWRPLPRR